MDPLKQDVLQAYDELGGIQYLMREPALLKRILMRLIKQQAPAPEIVIDLVQEMPWVDFSTRLSYKNPPEVIDLGATHVVLKAEGLGLGSEVVEAKVLPSPAENQAWKPERDSAQARLKAAIKKLSE